MDPGCNRRYCVMLKYTLTTSPAGQLCLNVGKYTQRWLPEPVRSPTDAGYQVYSLHESRTWTLVLSNVSFVAIVGCMRPLPQFLHKRGLSVSKLVDQSIK